MSCWADDKEKRVWESALNAVWDRVEDQMSQELYESALAEIEDLKSRLKKVEAERDRLKELYDGSIAMTRKLQAEREKGVQRVEAALLGIKGVE
jgi:hypothetical protein